MTDFAAARRIWWTARSAPPTSPTCASFPPCWKFRASASCRRPPLRSPISISTCRSARPPPAQADGAGQIDPGRRNRPATDRVLDAGCATGYRAAVLARVAGHVVALEEDTELAAAASAALAGHRQRDVVTGALAAGWPQAAPYDVIVLEGATEVRRTRCAINSKTAAGWSACSAPVPAPRPCSIGAAAMKSAAGRFSMPLRRSCRALPNRPFSPSKYRRKPHMRGMKIPIPYAILCAALGKGF